MAKVTQPLGSAEARGSVGGLVYNTWRGLHTVKTRSGPGTYGTQKQEAGKVLLYAANDAWAALDQADRDAWNDWAAHQRLPQWTGTDKRITGHNWFLRCHIQQARCFSSITMVIPIDPISHTLTNPVLVSYFGDTSLQWNWVKWTDHALHALELWTHKPSSAGRKPYLNLAQYCISDAYCVGELFTGETDAVLIDCFFRLTRSNGLVGPWEHLRWTPP